MNLEGLDCWDDYPMEHGCICGNDCAPPALPLDYAKRDEIARLLQRSFEEGTARLEHGWIVEVANRHTCGAGENGYYGAHEPGCGLIPIFDVAAAIARENHAPLPLDPMPWSVGDPRDGRAFRSATEATQPVEWCDFDPRPGYSQNREDYAS